MTNREKFEAEKTDFGKVMELFNKSGLTSFDEFFNKPVCKYKPGDIVVLDLTKEAREYEWKHNIVMSIDGVEPAGYGRYNVTLLTPDDTNPVGLQREFPFDFLDNNSHLY